MRDFMPDNSSYSPVVHRVIGLWIVEGWLHDARGEDDFIHAAAVVGVYRGWRHAPFRAVHGLPDFFQHPRNVESRAAHLVLGVRPAIDLKREPDAQGGIRRCAGAGKNRE